MIVALLAVVILAPAQSSAPPARFKWTAGDTHTYKVTQHTLVRETTLDPKTEKPVVSEARTSLDAHQEVEGPGGGR